MATSWGSVPGGTSCSDNNPCNGLETCNGTGTCTAGVPPVLDDGDACTVDSCDPVLGVIHTPVAMVDGGAPGTITACNPTTGVVAQTVCPPLDPTVVTLLSSAAACIYSGANPYQTGMSAPPNPVNISVLQGRVLAGGGGPLSGVEVYVLGHGLTDPQSYGHVYTLADGTFELAVNGGGPLTLVYKKPSYLSSQRTVNAQSQYYATAPDVVLLNLDPQVTEVDLSGESVETLVARGTVQTDTSGTRQATLLFPPGVTATMTVPSQADGGAPDGGTTTSVPVTSLHVRATEYTVGPNGPAAMPGTLPPTSSYTYAVELSADEAIAAGATSVVFDVAHPVPLYVDNFLGFPTGTVVPVGTYDTQKGTWVASEDGVVLQILSVSNGVAIIDVDGKGVPATSAELTSFGITTQEQETLATLYAPGKTLWRGEMQHFSAEDYNWFASANGACAPADSTCPLPDPKTDQAPICHDTTTGSIIECEGQILGEKVPVAGTPFSLHTRAIARSGVPRITRLRCR